MLRAEQGAFLQGHPRQGYTPGRTLPQLGLGYTQGPNPGCAPPENPIQSTPQVHPRATAARSASCSGLGDLLLLRAHLH